jgi:hypothetical protein
LVELSILVATVPSLRPGLLSRLLAVLEPQLRPAVEVIIHHNERKSMGRKFNELYQAAYGRLAVQVDDDDLVAVDFVDSILAVSPGHDFVGYQAQLTINGDPYSAVTYEIDPARAGTLKPYHPHDRVRHVTPKCPIETARAVAHPWTASYVGVDFDWTKGLIEDGYPFNPVFIPKVLYHYDCWPDHSLGTRPSEWTPQRVVPVVSYDPSRFTWIK